jgi:hypothetical protein
MTGLQTLKRTRKFPIARVGNHAEIAALTRWRFLIAQGTSPWRSAADRDERGSNGPEQANRRVEIVILNVGEAMPAWRVALR